MIATGQAIEVSFLRPVTSGHAEARGVARHRGRSTWVWQVEIVDDDERLCAVAKMTMAVRPAPRPDTEARTLRRTPGSMGRKPAYGSGFGPSAAVV